MTINKTEGEAREALGLKFFLFLPKCIRTFFDFFCVGAMKIGYSDQKSALT
jgi:hypothetical protein